MVEKNKKLNSSSSCLIAKEVINLNIIIIGNTNVGKTSIMDRHVNDKFNTAASATTGVDFARVRYFNEAGQRCSIKFWDTSGAERSWSLTE